MYKPFATPHYWIELGCGTHPGQIVGLNIEPHWQKKTGRLEAHRSIYVGVSLLFLTAWFEVVYYPIARDLKTLTIPPYTE